MAERARPLARARAFCAAYGLKIPILLAPMAGACPPALSIAVANAGGLGACGALPMDAEAMREWAAAFRAASDGGFQINLWIPDAAPRRDAAHERAVSAFLARWGPEPAADAGDTRPPDFAAQCATLLELRPRVVSSVMGLYPPTMVGAMKAREIRWFATATTVAEARLAAAAGADAIVAQGMEAGGHRGCFEAAKAEAGLVGLFSLLPAIAAAVAIPVIAAGGIADGRGVAAALALGADAVAVGTGFLRCPEAGLPPAWADALAATQPEDTLLTRAFSGRAGRALATAYTRAAEAPDAPTAASYPVQRGLTQAMRRAGHQNNDLDRMQAWAGQSAALATPGPAAEVALSLWDDAQSLLA